MERQDGVREASIDYKTKRATVEAGGGEALEPERLLKALNKAGFAGADVRLTAVGRLSGGRDPIVLEIGGTGRRLVLEGEAAREASASDGSGEGRMRVTGSFSPAAKKDAAATLAVESWEPLDAADGGP